MFDQRPQIAQAVLGRITKGKAVQNDDAKGLADLYYSLNDCLVRLQQLNYRSDLESSGLQGCTLNGQSSALSFEGKSNRT